MNKEIMKKAGFSNEVKAVEEKKCPFCNKAIDETKFRTELDRKEYKISGMCQQCQDETF